MSPSVKKVPLEQALAWMLSRYWYAVDERCGAPLSWLLVRGGPVTLGDIRELEAPAADRVWALMHPTLLPEGLRRAVSCDFAGRALPTWEDLYPEDSRPRAALEAAERHTRGEIDDAALRTAHRGAEAATQELRGAPHADRSAYTDADAEPTLGFRTSDAAAGPTLGHRSVDATTGPTLAHRTADAVAGAAVAHPDPWSVGYDASEAAALEAGRDFAEGAGPSYAHLAIQAQDQGRQDERDWQLERLYQRLVAHHGGPDGAGLELREFLAWCLARHYTGAPEARDQMRSDLASRPAALSAEEILDLDELPPADRVRAVLGPEFFTERQLSELACDFAEHVLRVAEAARPGAPFPEQCIQTARRIARGDAVWSEREEALAVLEEADFGSILKAGDLRAGASGPPSGLQGWMFAARAAAWTVACDSGRVAVWRASWDAVQAAYHATDEKLNEGGRPGGWDPGEMANREWAWQISTIRERLGGTAGAK